MNRRTPHEFTQTESQYKMPERPNKSMLVQSNAFSEPAPPKKAAPTPAELNIRSKIDRRKIVFWISNLLTYIVVNNDKMNTNPVVSRFHSKKVPSISLTKYLERISQYAVCSNESLVIAMIYIDRLLTRHQDLYFNSHDMHRLLITSVLLAGKMNDDCFFNNTHYSKVGGISRDEINCLEMSFIGMLGFDLHVTGEEYEDFFKMLVEFSRQMTTSVPVAFNRPIPTLKFVSQFLHSDGIQEAIRSIPSPCVTPVQYSKEMNDKQVEYLKTLYK